MTQHIRCCEHCESDFCMECVMINADALQAMHDLLVWMLCSGCTKFACTEDDFGGYFDTLLVAVETLAYEAGQDACAEEDREREW